MTRLPVPLSTPYSLGDVEDGWRSINCSNGKHWQFANVVVEVDGEPYQMGEDTAAFMVHACNSYIELCERENDLKVALQLTKEVLQAAVNRLETIKITSPEYHVDEDIKLYEERIQKNHDVVYRKRS